MRRVSITGWAGLAGLGLLCAQPAAAQDSGGFASPLAGGVQPGLGSGVNINSLRPQLERYFQPSTLPSTAPSFVVQSSIGVDVGVTDNAGETSTRRQADVYTVITPGIIVTQDSARIKSNLSYSPQIQEYATTSRQNQVSQFLNAQSKITFVQDLLFMDLRGSITQSPQIGSGFNNGQTNTYTRQNSVQSTSFSVTPYAEHRFGGWGTGRIGYSFARTLQDAGTGSGTTLDSLGNPVSNGGYGSVGNLTTQRERATFATGENLGRFNDLTTLEAIQYSGGGSYNDSHRNQALNEIGFALTRRFTLLAGLGYQDILYAGGTNANGSASTGVRINEPTWNFGGRYSPSPDSTVTVLYGRRDGSASASVNGQVSPTPRTRVFLRYSTGITSDIEDAQNLLETTDVGPTGLVTDSVTGAPVSGGGSSFGVQNGVYRVRRISATGLWLANRDSYSVSLTQEDRTTLTATTSYYNTSTIPAGTSTNNLSATFSWQHDLAPDLNSTLSLQYGTTTNTSQLVGNGNSRQNTISISASLNKQFTATLSGNVRYIFTDRTGGQAGIQNTIATQTNTNNYIENTLLVGLRKSF